VFGPGWQEAILGKLNRRAAEHRRLPPNLVQRALVGSTEDGSDQPAWVWWTIEASKVTPVFESVNVSDSAVDVTHQGVSPIPSARSSGETLISRRARETLISLHKPVLALLLG
jgi:hypothetical protein